MSTKKQPVQPLSTTSAIYTYPPADDIYNRDMVAQDINPEEISAEKPPNELNDIPKEIDLYNNFDGDDLDVPGAELDDADEEIGEEDEENNYYSIGGENHMELEEDHYD